MDLFFKRPLVLFAVSMILGIAVAGISNSFFLAAAVLMLLAVCLHLIYKRINRYLLIFVCTLAFFSIGAFEFLWMDRINTGRFGELGGEQITVKGFIASEPDIKENRVSYIVNVSEIRNNNEFRPKKGKLLLTSVLNENSSILEYGREVEFAGQLNLPKGVRNPGGFDYRRYLSQKGVSAVVFALDIKAGEGRRSSFLIDTGNTLRMKIVSIMERSLPRQQAGLLNGVLIGYREGLTKEVQAAFSDAGLTHIMAVSGANIAFLVLPLIFVFKKLRVRQNISCIFIIAFLILFIYITGFEPSVLRAVIMGIVMLLGKILMREPDIYTTLSLAAIVLLLFSPYMLFNIGFQLSFAATLSLVMLSKRIKVLLSFRSLPEAVTDVLAATISAQLGVLPITLYYFNKLSVISLVSNLLVVPLMEVITILGMIMAVFGQLWIFLAQVFGYVNCLLLSFVLFITQISSSLPFATVRLATPSIAFVLAYYLAVWFLFWYAPKKNIKIKLRYTAAAILPVCLIFFISIVLPGKLEVTYLDVGQGDSTFIRTYNGRTVLLDGGGSSNPEKLSSIGESVVIPFLLDKGVCRLDAIIASHGHTDHIQGLLPVLEQFAVGDLIIPEVSDEKEFEQLLETARKRGIRVGRCGAGDTVKLDGKTVFQVLNPLQQFSNNNSSLNNTSLVLKLIYGETELLFTGDAETEVEMALLSSGAPLEADVLKLAHHGSDTSTGMEFLEAINPRAVVISVGKNNFGHPSQEVMQRLNEKNLTIFRTDESGAVVLTSNGRKIRIKGTVPAMNPG